MLMAVHHDNPNDVIMCVMAPCPQPAPRYTSYETGKTYIDPIIHRDADYNAYVNVDPLTLEEIRAPVMGDTAEAAEGISLVLVSVLVIGGLAILGAVYR